MAVVTVDRYVELERRVSRRVGTEDSRRLLGEALAQVASAAIYPTHRSSAGTPHMTSLLEEPVARATEAAFEMLVDELSDAVELLTPAAVDELVAEQLAADLGME